jgi:hypothetical protein
MLLYTVLYTALQVSLRIHNPTGLVQTGAELLQVWLWSRYKLQAAPEWSFIQQAVSQWSSSAGLPPQGSQSSLIKCF